MELFAQRPMASVTVQEIAAASGVALRTLYRYFPTKEGIFAAFPRRGAEELAAAIRCRPTDETPYEALRGAFAEVASDAEIAEAERWLAAVVTSGAVDRIARLSLVVSTETLAVALADRSKLSPEDLWPQMAATMAAGALTVGTQRWASLGGRLVQHQLVALEIAGQGIANMPGAGSGH
jgi:AcrR family transcriptional regulator